MHGGGAPRVRNLRTAAGSYAPTPPVATSLIGPRGRQPRTDRHSRSVPPPTPACGRAEAALRAPGAAVRNVPGTRSGLQRSERSTVHASSGLAQLGTVIRGVAAKLVLVAARRSSKGVVHPNPNALPLGVAAPVRSAPPRRMALGLSAAAVPVRSRPPVAAKQRAGSPTKMLTTSTVLDRLVCQRGSNPRLSRG